MNGSVFFLRESIHVKNIDGDECIHANSTRTRPCRCVPGAGRHHTRTVAGVSPRSSGGKEAYDSRCWLLDEMIKLPLLYSPRHGIQNRTAYLLLQERAASSLPPCFPLFLFLSLTGIRRGFTLL